MKVGWEHINMDTFMELMNYTASGIWIALGIVFSIMTYKLIRVNIIGKSWKYKIGNMLAYLATLMLSGFFFGMAMWLLA